MSIEIAPSEIKKIIMMAGEGHAAAQYELGDMFFSGQGVNEDNKEAIKWYRKAAGQGHADAQYQLGEIYYYGQGVDEDYCEALDWYQQAAEQGHAKAQYALGKMYYSGQGVDEDYDEAAKWYRKAAKQGNAIAQNNLDLMYQEGKIISSDDFDDVPHDDDKDVNRYLKAAEQGNADAQFNLGVMYQDGKGVQQDDAEAVKWFHKAAEKKHPYAQTWLGWMYENGKGVPQNDAEAIKLYSKAVEQGHMDAQKFLDKLKAKGIIEDVPWKGAASTQYFRESAEKGDAYAQYKLGEMYRKGEGVPKDDAEAIKWYHKAVEQGNEEAKHKLEEMKDIYIDENEYENIEDSKVENIITATSNLSIDIIFNNPFRILGLPANAKETEILKQVNNLRTFIEIGKNPKIDMEISCFPSCNRTLEIIDEAKKKIEQSDGRFLNSFFWYSNEDSVNQLALDVLSEGKIKKSIALWEKHLGQYNIDLDSFKENSQPEYLKDAIIDRILIPYLEDNYNIDIILSEIPSENELRIILGYFATDIMEWHLNSDDYFYDVVSDDPIGIDDNGEDMTLDIQINKTSIDALITDLGGKSLILPEKELSYAKNLMVLYLGLAFKKNELNLTHFNKSLCYAGMLFHSSESLSQYASSMIGTHYRKDDSSKIAKFFIAEIVKCIKPLLDDNISNETFKKIVESFSSFPDNLNKEVLRELTNKPIRDIKKKVEETEKNREMNPLKANEYGKELYDNIYDTLIRLKDVLSVNDLQYQNISDAVANEILSCFVDYYRGNNEAENNVDPEEQALELAQYAETLAVSARLKKRIEEWIPIFKRAVKSKPAREQRRKAKPHIDFIVEQLRGLRNADSISPNELIIAEGFMNSCMSSLKSLKNIFVRNNRLIPSITVFEGFEDNENKWSEVTDQKFSRKIEDDKYILQNSNEKDSYWTWGLNHIYFSKLSDFTFECSMTKVDGADDRHYGIVWSYKKNGEESCYYMSFISGDGQCYFREKNKEGKWVGGFQWKKSEHVNQGNETNVLKVCKKGDSVDLYINDNLIIVEEPILVENMSGTGIGFWVDPNMTIEVNYLNFCNAYVDDFYAIFDHKRYMDLSSSVANRTLSLCIAYGNRTNDMEKTILLMNKIKQLDMQPELKKKFDENENILNNNLRIKEANTPQVKKLFNKVMKWLE